jgi:hypothetical protein
VRLGLGAVGYVWAAVFAYGRTAEFAIFTIDIAVYWSMSPSLKLDVRADIRLAVKGERCPVAIKGQLLKLKVG